MRNFYKEKSPVKRKLFCIFALLVIAAVTVVAYYEIHFDTDEVVTVNISEEKILKEMPDIALTETDYAFGERVLADPAVISAMEKGESRDLPEETVAELFADYLPEGAVSQGIAVHQKIVYCGYLQNEKQSVWLTFFQNGEYGPYKTITVYRGNGKTFNVTYENQAGKLQKLKMSHRWFAYLRDRVWKET
jgi:hypothetical protein